LGYRVALITIVSAQHDRLKGGRLPRL